MPEHMPIMIGDKAIEKFIEFCQQKQYEKFMIVADKNTAHALGDSVFQAVKQKGWDVIYHVLDPEGLHTDETTLTRVLNAYDAIPRLFVAVGSGTITDTVRFTSHRSQNQFVSFPTAFERINLLPCTDCNIHRSADNLRVTKISDRFWFWRSNQ